jgi:hypothetical protein
MVTKEWLKDVLSKGGYETRYGERDAFSVLCRHPSRPNISVKHRPDQNIVLVSHAWGLNRPGWGQEKGLLEAINKANSASWYDTVYRDSEGDMGVSSYMYLCESLRESDLLGFVEREAMHFMGLLGQTGLRAWIK